MITGIVVALPEEISTLTSKKIAKGECAFINDKVLLAYAGAGESNARQAAQLLVSQGVSQLISWGCAAALAAHLNPGDLVLAENVLSLDGEYPVDPSWQQACHRLLSGSVVVESGRLFTSKQLVSSSLEKQQIQQQTSAIALDMETAAIAQVAQQHGLPFLVVRAIADPASMDLPQAVAYALNADGHVELTKLLSFLFRHPSELPGLIKLGLHFSAAKKTLLVAAKQLQKIASFNNTP